MKKIILICFIALLALDVIAQTGPGGVGNNSGAGNLKFWLRGDSVSIDTGVDTLFDLSGYNNHFVQTVAAEQPTITAINGFDVLNFDGAGDYLLDDDGESYINGQSAFTLLFVIKSDLTGTDKGFFIADDPGSTDDSLSVRYDITGDNGGLSNIITAGTGANGPIESSEDIQTTDEQLVTFTWASNSTPELYIDGTQDFLSYSNLIVGSISGSDKVILGKGSQDTGVGDGWDGIIGEVIYFNNQLNSAERTIVENYLATRYNLTISNNEYTPADAGYKYDIVGIGVESDGDHNGSVSAGFGINEDNSTLDTDGEYVFASHDNTTNDIASINTTDVVGPVEAAWNRSWYVAKSGGANIDLKINFDFGDGIEGGGIPQNISNYRLLYRVGTSGNYSVVTTSNIGIQSGDQVYFEVTNANIANGYYTIGTIDQTNSPVEGSSTQTWYTLVSGDWEDDQIWTLDPSGALPDNPETEIPDANDNVVVLSGKTVTVNANNYDANSISVEGRLYLGTTNGHDFTDINGNGRIYIEGDYFPEGDSTDFVTSGLDEGTVVYSGGVNFDLTEPRTFYNMEIIMDAAADIVTLECDYIINGNLKVEKGVLQINDAINTTPLVIDIEGDVDVDATGSITVGTADAYDAGAEAGYGNYHKGIHQVYVGGDFLNQGTVRFTNQAVPDYANLTATGGVSLVFDGATNNSFTCENTTDLYNLVIDKGTDQTYELSIYAEDTSHFAMFGQNNDNWNTTGNPANPETRKALWIKAGTMRLSGEIYIPSLTEGSRDFFIGENARIVLDGPNVFLGITAEAAGDFPAELSHGLPVNFSGTCSNQGLYVFGKLQVNNGYFYLGEAEAVNFRDEAPGVIEVNGGTLEADEIAISSSASAGNYSFILTGGTVLLTGATCPDGANAILHLDNSDMVFTMSGGEIRIEGVGPGSTPTNGILIGCDEGNYNVTGGTVYIDYTGATDVEISSTANFYSLVVENNTDVILQSALEISDSIAIRNGASLDAAGFGLSVGGDFIYDNGATYTHGNNTTTFFGDLDSDIKIGATTGSLGFYNLIIEKDKHPTAGSYYDVTIPECTGRTTDPADADNTIISIANDLTITRGQFTIQRYTVSLSGDVAMTDGKMIYNSSLPGRLTLEGAAAQTITGSAIYSPVFGNVELDNTNGGSLITDIEMENFILTTGILNIGINRLSVDTNFIENGNAVAFSVTKMIETSADHGARGLKFKMDDNYGIETVTFPVGSNGNWAKADINIDNIGVVSGTVTFVPVDLSHPTRNFGGCGAGDAIDFYWKSTSTGLSAINTDVEYEIYCPYATGPPEQEQYLIDGDWNSSGNASGPGTLSFEEGNLNGFPEEIDFTAGKNACYNSIDYVISQGSGDWNVAGTWAADGPPTSYDYVYILDGHTVDVTANNQDAGKLYIYSGGTLNVSNYTGLDYNIVKGGGEIRISSNTIPTADFEEFMNNDTAIWEYYGGSYTIPTDFAAYPYLEITGSGAKTLPNQDVLVNQNLTIDDETLILNDGDDLYVTDSIIIDNDGILRYPTNSDPCEVTVFKSVDLSRNAGANTIEVIAGGSNTGNHRLTVWEDIILNSNADIDFYDAADNAVDLYFDGDGNSEVNDAGGASIDLNRLVIDKAVNTSDVDFLEAFTLSGPTNGTSTEKALYLISGDLTIDDAGTNINLSTGGGDFKIPSTASLTTLNATLNISGANTGIKLDGYMGVDDNSSWLLNGGTNNYIEYTASGNAEIFIEQGTLRVGSQIRRQTYTTDGVLKFTQNHSNSTVVIGENDAPTGSRGVFEIANIGSEFNQVAGANITIVREQTAASLAALYLYPETSSIGAGASFTIGDDANTPAGQTIGINSNINLKTLIVNSTNSPIAQMQIKSLTLEEDLTIEAGATLDANGFDLNIQGDMVNSGTFTANSNTTTFNGSTTQQIIGNTTFYNLTKSTTNTLCLNGTTSSNIDIDNEFRLELGTFRDSSNAVTVQGDLYNDATHEYGGAGNGIELNGTSEQTISGTGSGSFGYLTISNASGVEVSAGNEMTITDGLNLNGGIFDVGNNLLDLGLNADVIAGAAFSSSNMIQTNISFTDNGVRKTFPAGASTFLLPIGSEGKYTPVDYDVTANDNSTGTITTKAADEMHPSILEDSETPEIEDAKNVLQYHWVIKTNGISGFSADVEMTYYESDVYVEAPYNVSDYITARLLNDGSGSWNKYTTDDFDESNQLLKFAFSNVDDDEIEGDYTAGIDDAIPDQVPFYETNQSGSWTDGTIWTPNVSGGPQGAMVRINTNDTVYMPSNFQKSYITTINGRVEVDSTFGHRLGEVDGTGTLYTKRASLPAGDYTDFFSSSGGTLEYGGIGPDYDILASFSYVNNLKLSGTGERRFPNQDITLLGDLIIDGDDATLEVINENDQKITIEGDISYVTGSFDAGDDVNAIVEMNGTAAQTITGNFTGTNDFYHFEINNSSGVTLSGPIDIEGDLTFTSGVITTTAANILTMTDEVLSSVSGYSSSNYVDGPMRKLLANGSTFIFPVGDAARYGRVEVVSTNTSGSQYWEAEYYNANPHASYDTSSRLAPLEMVSGNEYWRIEGPAAGTRESGVKIRWDSNSMLPAMTDDRPNNLHIAEWIGGGTDEWQSVGTDVTDNGINDGTIQTDAVVALDEHYFTIGTSESAPLPTAGFISSDTSICLGGTADLIVQLTGTAPWTIKVDSAGTNWTHAAIAASPYTINTSPVDNTTYTITEVTDATPTTSTTTIFGSPVTVTVIPLPTAFNVTGGGSYCAGGSGVSVGLSGSQSGVNYELFVGVTSLGIWGGTGGVLDFGNQTTAGTYTVDAWDGTATCKTDMALNAVVTINPLPVFVPTATPGTICFGDNSQLDANIGPAGYTYTWSPAGDLSASNIQNPVYTPAANPTSPTQVTITFSVTVTDANTCSDVETVDVIVNRTPETGPEYTIPNDHAN